MTGRRRAKPSEERPAGRRALLGTQDNEPLRLAGVELVGVDGEAGELLDARQNAAIKEILLWLQQHRGRAARP